MSVARGFPPLSRSDARILILGSMPGRESLARQQYYAHARNAFWPIVCELLGITDSSYTERAAQAMQHGVAIWDVLNACERPGSLDSDIQSQTMVANDFTKFFKQHSRISSVFFNGAKAESVYLKHVLPILEPGTASLPLQRLPSTSPANAAMTYEQKKDAWRMILE